MSQLLLDRCIQARSDYKDSMAAFKKTRTSYNREALEEAREDVVTDCSRMNKRLAQLTAARLAREAKAAKEARRVLQKKLNSPLTKSALDESCIV